MKKIIGIATTGDRQTQLDRTVLSLSGQADEIHIYNNKKRRDLTDLGKFYALKSIEEPVYYFSCDDDLIYPSDYVEKTIDYIESFGCIVSYHGRVLKDREKYYGADHYGVRFWQAHKAMRLDVSGTGVTAFRTDYFKPKIWNEPYKKMADLVFSLEACKQGKKIMHPPKNMDWIVEQPVKNSIFKSERLGDQVHQVELMKQILECKNG